MKWLIKVIFKVVKGLINILLSPLNYVINQFMPDLANAIANVNTFFSNITAGILWVKSWLPFDTGFYVILVAVLTFKFMVPLLTHTIKIVVGWYNKLKP